MKKLVCVCLAAALILSLAACGGSNGASGSASGDASGAAAGATAEYILGGMGPITGPAASYGTSVQNGAQVAIDEINAAGGVKVGDTTYTFRMEFADDEATEDKAIQAYNSLVDKKIQALVGPTTSGAAIAIADQTYADGILTVTPSGSAMDCVKNPNAFRICFTDPLQGETMAEFIVKDQGYTNVAVLYSNTSDYGKGIRDAFVAKVAELGGTLGSDGKADYAYADGDVEFTSQLTNIKNSGAQALFVPGYYQEATYIAKQAAEMGLNIPIFGSDGWDGVLKTVTDPATVEGVIFLSPFFASDESELVKKFVENYQKAYGAVPDQFAADAYDAVYVIKAAMEKAGSIDSTAMIAAMTQISIDGLTGENMKFTADGEPAKGAKFIQIVNGEYTAYTGK